MKKLFTLFVVLFISTLGFAQDIEYKEYSYTEFFKLIEAEQDTIFKLKDAIIKFSAKTDSAFIVKSPFMEPVEPMIKRPKIIIEKEIRLENVLFSNTFNRVTDSISVASTLYENGVLHNIHFKKPIKLITCLGLCLYNSEFDERLDVTNNTICNYNQEFYRTKGINPSLSLGNNTFHKGLSILKFCDSNNIYFNITLFLNTININDNPKSNRTNGLNISTFQGGSILFFKNKLSGNRMAIIRQKDVDQITISENDFGDVRAIFDFVGTHESLVLNKNKFTSAIQLGLNNLSATDVIEWKQFNSNFYSEIAYENYVGLLPDEAYFKTETDSFRSLYMKNIRIQNAEVYAGEAALKGTLYRHYRENFDMVRANDVFMNLKDFETARLAHLYEANPSFDTFFTWKVNQFLKVFSNYGTKPSKAITFSVYVVFVFALIYLFFPNSWDKHGRNRIINRYTFFTKYMNQNLGIHEVYLEDQKDDLLEYHEFKHYMESSGKTIPKFFSTTALPLYKWAISGTKLFASILKRVDIMKGTWQELPAHKRFWKSILLVGAFLIAILYDIFIKMLNALMLSINTFTTLGFGEIPIKGLPRYLAIIQGFIGWFMLTIFSVSLISQLLN